MSFSQPIDITIDPGSVTTDALEAELAGASIPAQAISVSRDEPGEPSMCFLDYATEPDQEMKDAAEVIVHLNCQTPGDIPDMMAQLDPPLS